MKANFKSRIIILLAFLFIIPIIDITIFNATNSLLSAVIIIFSLLLFFVLALISTDRIIEQFSNFLSNTTADEISRRTELDETAISIKNEIDHVMADLSALKNNSDNVLINDIKNRLTSIIGQMDEIVFLESNGIHIDRSTYEVKFNGDDISLTNIEFELLWVFLEKRNTLLSREYILQRVWGYDYLGPSRSIDMAVARLRKKIPVLNSKIVTVSGHGYKYI